MALDERDERLFVGCRLPAWLVILDTNSGQVVAKLPVVGDADDVFFHPTRHLVYVIGGEGAVDIFRMHDPNRYDHVGRTNTATGARTGLFVSDLDRLFVAVPHRGSQGFSFTKSNSLRNEGIANPGGSSLDARLPLA
jgi:hypothetical protein